MNTYDIKLAEYYDILYSQKNYDAENEIIKSFSKKGGHLLDVGCGTMSHIVGFSNYFETITGLDVSEHMLKIGCKKMSRCNINNVRTHCGPVDTLKISHQFDTCISMFNVINHIKTVSDLTLYFKSIYTLLKKDGVFIFDCWNGVACTIEKPIEHMVREYIVDDVKYVATTTTETDIYIGCSIMTTEISISKQDKSIDKFSYKLEQKFWYPSIIQDLLVSNNFKIIKTFPYLHLDKQPSEKDYRLTYVCKKI